MFLEKLKKIIFIYLRKNKLLRNFKTRINSNFNNGSYNLSFYYKKRSSFKWEMKWIKKGELLSKCKMQFKNNLILIFYKC